MREIGGDNRAKLHCIIISSSNSSRVVLRIEVSGGDVFFIIQIVLMCAFVLILGCVLFLCGKRQISKDCNSLLSFAKLPSFVLGCKIYYSTINNYFNKCSLPYCIF